MGSPLGPLLANTFMCSLEEQLKLQNKLPSYYKRYVDDTLTVMKDEVSAYSFLHVLNDLHPSISFTMELPTENTLPFLGMVLRKDSQNITTSVYVKPTNTGLLLHYNSHVDNRYKKSLIITKLDRAFKLSSNWSLFHEECIRLKTLFLQLAYPEHLIHSMISNFIASKQTRTPPRNSTSDQQSVRIVLPFKEQNSADSVRKQLKDLGKLLNIDLCPVFISRKVGQDLKHKEIKPALINEQSVVYKFECGWCDASYVGYTRRHLYQRIDEHKRSGSIFNHSQRQHPSRTITSNMFHILKKCSSKFDCLLYEMFLIREHKPCLNIQSDSIKAKLFT